MAHSQENDHAGTDPIDLGALRAAAAPVIAWYEQLLAGRPMAVADLDRALVGIRALPPISGRLGKALALVATGARAATTEEAVAALELLRHSAGLRHLPPPPPPPPGGTAPPPGAARAYRRERDCTQLPLPGITDR